MKSLKSILVVLLLNISSLNAIDLNKVFCGFTDVKVSKYCFDIHWGKITKVVNGKEEKGILFEPKEFLNRAEIAKIMILSSGHKPNEDIKLKPFKDTPIDAWFTPYVDFAKKEGWVQGINQGKDDEFDPMGKVPLAQALKMLILAHSPISAPSENSSVHYIYYGESKGNKLVTFDESIGAWYDTYMNWAEDNNFSIFDDSSMSYDKELTREEVLSISKEVKDMLTCDISTYDEEIIAKSNSTFLKEQKPNCYEKALYYSYVMYGSKYLDARLADINTKKENLDSAEKIVDTIIDKLEDLLSEPISVNENCIEKTYDFMNEYTDFIKNETINNSMEQSNLDTIKYVYGVLCEVKKNYNPTEKIPKKKLKKIISKIFLLPKAMSSIVLDDFKSQLEVKKLSLRVAYAVLGEYYKYGGNLEELFKEHDNVNNMDSLINKIAKDNGYQLSDEKRVWQYFQNTFSLELTKIYASEVFKIVNSTYKWEM